MFSSSPLPFWVSGSGVAPCTGFFGGVVVGVGAGVDIGVAVNLVPGLLVLDFVPGPFGVSKGSFKSKCRLTF